MALGMLLAWLRRKIVVPSRFQIKAFKSQAFARAVHEQSSAFHFLELYQEVEQLDGVTIAICNKRPLFAVESARLFRNRRSLRTPSFSSTKRLRVRSSCCHSGVESLSTLGSLTLDKAF